MGTIADLLGAQLPDGWQNNDEQGSDAVAEAAPPGAETPPSSDAIVIEIILDETGFPPEQMRPELRLDTELDLTGLALWSVVSRIEREVGRSLPDSDVESWRTLSDILSAASNGPA